MFRPPKMSVFHSKLLLDTLQVLHREGRKSCLKKFKMVDFYELLVCNNE